jgi:hydroxyacylglutathione hydrolase
MVIQTDMFKKISALVLVLCTGLIASLLSVSLPAQGNVKQGRKSSPKMDTVKVRHVLPEHVIIAIDFDEKSTVIDVRSPKEFAEGHIRTAINIPFEEFESRVEEIRKKYGNRHIVTVCDGLGTKGLTACGILIRNKISGVRYLKGGMDNWVGMNMKVEKSTK